MDFTAGITIRLAILYATFSFLNRLVFAVQSLPIVDRYPMALIIISNEMKSPNQMSID